MKILGSMRVSWDADGPTCPPATARHVSCRRGNVRAAGYVYARCR